MTDIVLCTFNARYTHSSLALRTLYANLGPLQERASIVELVIGQRVEDAAEILLAAEPRIIGLSVSIWNADAALGLAQILRALAPDTTLVLGGPEVSHEPGSQRVVALADYVVCGEGELAFRQLCEAIFAGAPPKEKTVVAATPDLAQLELPYAHYRDSDLADRVLYVEASRGCPYRCAFCLSALDRGVRYFPRQPFFSAMEALLDRGARRFKFVDRTFNLDTSGAIEVLDFFAARPERDVFLHLEAVPDRLPPALLEAIERLGPKRVQLELGVQSTNGSTLEVVGIRRNTKAVLENIQRLVALGVNTHADLIAGLPGEDLESFGRGFDALFASGVDEIQLGVLKRLRGAPLCDAPYAAQMVFSERAPYELLHSDALTFNELQQLKRAAYLWDRVGNNGNFDSLVPLLARDDSLFSGLMSLTRWVHREVGRVHAIALDRLAELLMVYLVHETGADGEHIAQLLVDEYTRAGQKLPRFLRAHGRTSTVIDASDVDRGLPERQRRRRRR